MSQQEETDRAGLERDRLGVSSGSPLRSAVVAVLFPCLATLAAIPLSRHGSETAISLYMMAVVGAAAVGGLWGGLAAAIVSSLGLNFFFSAPRYSFRLNRVEDLVATLVFLAVAMVVGLLVARSIAERERSAARERDARLLSYLVTKLLSGEPVQTLLEDLAQVLLDPLGLARCEVRALVDGRELQATAERRDALPGSVEVVQIEIGGARLGTLRAVRRQGDRGLRPAERSVLEAAAKQMAVALERLRLDARARESQLEAETNQLRAALFSSVTHDLRTPLASIKAGVTSLLDPEARHDPSQEQELLMTILEETDRLNRLVGNIMDLARIRAGALVPAREAAAIDEIVQAVIARMRAQLTGHTIRTNIRADLPDVFVDSDQIDQVFTNLLDNAVHYSPPGGEIQISASPFRDVVQVRVTDQGCGIPEHDRARVFEAFYRGDSGPQRPGTGLGLAIAHAIVIGHGGRIWVEGAPGGGAAMVFELPVSGGAGE
jgi:two-component system, OmpR family, sensor histidine kinase KdpD